MTVKNIWQKVLKKYSLKFFSWNFQFYKFMWKWWKEICISEANSAFICNSLILFHFPWTECWFRITFSSYFNCKQIKIYYYLVQNRNLDIVSFKRTPDVHSYVVNKNVYDTFSPKLHIVQFLKWLLFGTLWIFYVLFLFYYATFGVFISNSTYLHSAAIFWHSFSLVRWIN